MAKKNDINGDDYQLGQRIRKNRKGLHLTQSELGEMVGLDRSAISNYENGSKGAMRFTLLKRISMALCVSVAILIGVDTDTDVLAGLNCENRIFALQFIDILRSNQEYKDLKLHNKK